MTFEARISLLAAAIMHVEGAFSINSLAHKNKNPGNIRNWGELPENGGYTVFPTILDGYEAVCQDATKNCNLTIHDFISKWAPPSENDTVNYVNVVCSITGFHPEELVGEE